MLAVKITFKIEVVAILKTLDRYQQHYSILIIIYGFIELKLQILAKQLEWDPTFGTHFWKCGLRWFRIRTPRSACFPNCWGKRSTAGICSCRSHPLRSLKTFVGLPSRRTRDWIPGLRTSWGRGRCKSNCHSAMGGWLLGGGGGRGWNKLKLIKKINI